MPDERDARSLYIDLGSSQIYKPAGLVRCGMTPLPDPTGRAKRSQARCPFIHFLGLSNVPVPLPSYCTCMKSETCVVVEFRSGFCVYCTVHTAESPPLPTKPPTPSLSPWHIPTQHRPDVLQSCSRTASLPTTTCPKLRFNLCRVRWDCRVGG
jgi:hypothetical protein